MNYDIIAFGSAVRDNYLVLKKTSKIIRGKIFCFPLGSKIEVEEMQTFSGGGGANTAATFAKQGISVAYLGKVGQDKRGEAVIEELKKIGINTRFIKRDKKHHTAYSLIISLPTGERTIFTYRGASNFLTKREIPWQKIKKTKWFYLAPFSGPLAELTESIVNFAHQNKIKVALNPGYAQLKFPQRILERILAKTDVLLLNREEASLLAGIPYQKEGQIFKKIDSLTKGVTIMTKGEEGAVASDGKYFYHVSGSRQRVVDKTGAGDSFGAGFVAGLLQGKGIEGALQLARANAQACLKEKGAKTGLLKKGQKYSKTKIIKKKHYEETGLCEVKF